MSVLSRIKKEVKGKGIRIVFPDGHEPTILKAAAILVKQKLATPYFIGNHGTIKDLCKQHNISMKGFEVRDPYFDENTNSFAKEYYELRRHKGVSEEQARQTCLESPYFAAFMLKHKLVDGMVSGYNSSTKPFLPAFHIIGTKNNKASSYFIMLKKKQILLYADCGLIIQPSEQELAEIATTTAKSAQLWKLRPVVAMLSFSTKGSAKHQSVDKVRNATELVKKQEPSLDIDGEVQFDAAFNTVIAKKKNANFVHQANIFVFPDLNAGNIAYKITERLAGFTAIGPLLQGLKQPVNDMSRGANVLDIVDIALITCYEALHQ